MKRGGYVIAPSIGDALVAMVVADSAKGNLFRETAVLVATLNFLGEMACSVEEEVVKNYPTQETLTPQQ